MHFAQPSNCRSFGARSSPLDLRAMIPTTAKIILLIGAAIFGWMAIAAVARGRFFDSDEPTNEIVREERPRAFWAAVAGTSFLAALMTGMAFDAPPVRWLARVLAPLLG